MPASKFGKEGAERPSFAAVRLVKPTADAANRFEELLVFKKFLVGFCALDHDLGLAIHCEDGGFPGLFQLANEVLRISLKIAQGVDVCEIEAHALNLHEIACSCERGYPASLNQGISTHHQSP